MHNDGAKDIPTIWILSANIVRTAQYGCNCRGMGTGGRWKGGCGELDVLEVLWTNLNKVTSTVYSFKGAIGVGEYADRVVSYNIVYVTIFDNSRNGGTVKILATVITDSLVQSWVDTEGVTVDFGK